MGFILKNLDEDHFSKMQDSWLCLLQRSPANKLFLSWEWQYTWWSQWASKREYELILLGVFGEDEKLYGLAPMYRWNKKLYGVFKVAQLQFIGSNWGGESTVRTEYIDFIIDKEHSDEVLNILIEYITSSIKWDQFIVEDITPNSYCYQAIQDIKSLEKIYKRNVRRDRGVFVNTSEEFDDYISNISSSVRRKIFNKRKLLEKIKNLRIEEAKDIKEADLYFKVMNRLHHIRWGTFCFYKEDLEFHLTLTNIFFEKGLVHLSMIIADSQPVSVIYNIICDGVEYNIQVGFSDLFNRKLSIGGLHLGYMIEKSFNNTDISALDLLAGPGKNSFYKNDYSSAQIVFDTYLITKHPILEKIESLRSVIPVKLKDQARKLTKIRKKLS